jgi:ATP-binding cassette subfamily A (ABC1) protein 3
VKGVLPLFLLYAFILPVFTIVSLLVKEKESKARESMRMMGMTDFPYWLSWFIYYTIINTVLSLVAWGVLCINVIGQSNVFYVFIWIWLYGESIFGQIIFMQALFQRAKFSGLIAAVVYFTLVLANIPVQSTSTQKLPRFILSLIPQVASQ